MAIVEVHIPLVVVSASVTALNRAETVAHEVDTMIDWSTFVEMHRRHADRGFYKKVDTDEMAGPVNVRTVCGKQLDGLFVTRQRKRPCELCTKVVRERKATVVVWPPGLMALQWNYIGRALDRHRRSGPMVKVVYEDPPVPPPPRPKPDSGQGDFGWNI